MRHSDSIITLYNARFDQEADHDIYKRTVLTGVSYFSRVKTNVSGDGGLVAANEITIRIPGELCSGYVPSSSYDGAVGTWTLEPGAIIVRGEATEENPRPDELKSKYGEIVTVLGVTDNRGSKGPHIKVVGR